MGKKIIWFDIGHLAQYNFYKQAIIQLACEHPVYVTLLNRGPLGKIVRQEIGDIRSIRITTIGKHCKTKMGIYLRSNVLRIISLFLFAVKSKPSIALSNGFQTALVSKLLCFPGIEFGDDIRGLDSKLKGLFSEYSQYCIPNVDVPGIKTIQCPKEWAYLAPKHFCPNKEVLDAYGLTAFKYIFVREVDTRTTNYAGQAQNAVLRAKINVPHGYRVLLSLEIRSQREMYPSDWILINQSEKNIHSLIYYSAAVIASGDSMAREGSALGVPSIYCGQRTMLANQTFIDASIMKHLATENVNSELSSILSVVASDEEREHIREVLDDMWIDPTEYIINLINKII